MVLQRYKLLNFFSLYMGIIFCSLVVQLGMDQSAQADDKLKADCRAKLEKARLWIRATDFKAPEEEKIQVRSAIDATNITCSAAMASSPSDGEVLVNTAYALFAAGDKKEGMKLIEQASKIGYPPAMVMVARYMGQGKYIEKDSEGAWLLLIRVLKTKHSSARIQAALEFLPGGVGPESVKRTKTVLRELINNGNGEAMVTYAMKVLKLQDAKVGSEKAKEGIELLERAASKAKNPKALIFLSLLYNQGNMVKRNKEKAIEYAQLAIDSKIPRAFGTMGQIYQNQGDNESAVEWFRKGAAIGDGFSQGMLGFMYSGGFGVAQDLGKAVEWWTKGRWNGDKMASSYLRVHRDREQAKKIWEESQKEEVKK